MALNLSGRSVLTLLDFTSEEIEYMLDLSKNFKDMKRAGYPHRFLEGKNIVLLFEKTSTRTRCAFEVGGMDLGMGREPTSTPARRSMGQERVHRGYRPRTRSYV